MSACPIIVDVNFVYLVQVLSARFFVHNVNHFFPSSVRIWEDLLSVMHKP